MTNEVPPGVVVDENTPGTGFLVCCLNCSQRIGFLHLRGCEFMTGEYDPRRFRGILHETAAQVRESKHG